MNLKDIPYVGNPGSACALACYTMVAKYFFPDTTFEDLAKVSRWEKGYVVWEMPFWNWIMNHEISVTNYDVIDYSLWAKEGVEGLRKAVPVKEFSYYKERTYDLESYTEDIRLMLTNKLYTQHKRNPTWEDLERHYEEGSVCAVVLNAMALNNSEGFALHQVIVTELADGYITFHDPQGKGKERPNRTESIQHFKHAWLETVSAPSLVAYLNS